MSTNLSEAIQEAYASAPPGVIELVTLEIYHPSWSAPVRLVRDRVALTATLESTAPNNPSTAVDFQPFPFTFTLPQKGSGRQDLQIAIENCTLLLMAAIEALDLSVDNPVRIIYRPYVSTDLTAPAMNPPLALVVRQISASPSTVTLTATYADFANFRFPRQLYTTTAFPGLDSRVGSGS